MEKAGMTALALALLSSLVLSAAVEVREVRMEIPTYLTGPNDPAPPFFDLRVYPYPLQTDITRTRELRPHRVVILENEYIRVLILPDIGGRILAALDKTNRNFDFIYHNHVIKPGLVALRGAWLSGGIEWNFPTLGHTVNTVDPVKYEIVRGADGSATCVVGTEEWVRRMKWEVFITVSPGRSSFTTRIRLENRTLTHNNAYFWANAATHAWHDTRVIFPPTNYTYAGGRSNPTPWPIVQGRDVSWVRNTARPYDYFCGTPGDFNGAYNYDHDNGTAHYADRYESPGKKFWTWGTAPSGEIWVDLLTDTDGQYIEVQSGRLLTQGDTWIFEPLLREEWTEWWFPLKKMRGFVKATPRAALNFELQEEGAFLALNTTEALQGVTLKLSQNGREVFADTLDITPAEAYQKEVRLAQKDGPFRVDVLDASGQMILDYSTEQAVPPPPELQPSVPEEAAQTPETAYLKGYYALKHWDAESAMSWFQKALELDAGHTDAARWLGLLYFKTGRTAEALELFGRVLARDEDDHAARYYRALAKKSLGIMERTAEDLAMASRRASFRHAAPYVRASLAAADRDYEAAQRLLQECLAVNVLETKTRVMRAALLRQLGKKEEAEGELAAILADDPIDSLALIERSLLLGLPAPATLRGEAEYFLEAACDYDDFGLTEDAVHAIELYFGRKDARPHPVLYYHWAWYCQRLGRPEEAKARFAEAAACAPDYVFPFRVETERALRAAGEHNPSDWKASYYLGNLLTAHLRWTEGLQEFRKAAANRPAFAVLYRNMGEIFWKKMNDVARAAEMYATAVSLDRNDDRLLGILDELYGQLGRQEERNQLFELAPEAAKANFNIILRRAQYLVEVGEFEEALSLLKANTFLPWEGGTSGHQVWVAANLKNALRLIAAEKYIKALLFINAAKTFPQNLGTGRPADPVSVREDYWLGLCYENMDKGPLAERSYQAVLAAPSSGDPEVSYYRALTLRRLGRAQEGDSLFKTMRREAEDLIGRAKAVSGATYYQAALACQGLGHKDKALAYLAAATKLEPSYRWTTLIKDEQAAFQ